ncbi:MAG: glucuronate isomerase [Clostridia bacterium]|nr:glucuronate isomerase [Clostridia bacterium]
MQSSQAFSYDFGILASELRSAHCVRTVTDLLFDKDVEALLRLCEIPSHRFSEKASQYDKFCALCKACELAEGHPTALWCQVLLEKVFGIDLPLLPENCETIWQKSSVLLQETAMTWQAALERLYGQSPVRLLWQDADGLDELPKNCVPVLDGSLFCQTNLDMSWQSFVASAQKTLDTFEEKGCRSVFFTLSEDYTFDEPNLYTVNQLLERQDPSLLQGDLWTTQVLRLLSAECKKRSWALCLRLHCDEGELLRLISYLQSSVGLCRLLFSASHPSAEQAMLDVQAREHGEEMTWALWRRDYPTTLSWKGALQSYRERYPIGRLQILTAANCYKTPFLQGNCE